MPSTSDTISAFVVATDCEEGGSDWRSGIDVSEALAQAAASDSMRANVVERMVAEQKSHDDRASSRKYAERCRTLRGCDHTCNDLPGYNDPYWHSRQQWTQHRRLHDQNQPSPNLSHRRFEGHNTLSTDEALLVANALVDPMCPLFLVAFATTSRDVYALSKSLLWKLRMQHRLVLNLVRTEGYSLRDEILRESLQRLRMKEVLSIDSSGSWWWSFAQLTPHAVTATLQGGVKYLTPAIDALVTCQPWWSSLTTIDFSGAFRRDDTVGESGRDIAALLNELAEGIASAASLRVVLLTSEQRTVAVAKDAEERVIAARVNARHTASLRDAHAADEPETTNIEAHRVWEIQMAANRKQCERDEAHRKQVEVKAEEERAVVRAEEAVVHACQQLKIRGRPIMLARAVDDADSHSQRDDSLGRGAGVSMRLVWADNPRHGYTWRASLPTEAAPIQGLHYL